MNASYDHYLVNRAYLSDITVADISEGFTHNMAAKTSWHRYESKLRHRHPMYTVSQKKTRHQTLAHNFPKC